MRLPVIRKGKKIRTEKLCAENEERHRNGNMASWILFPNAEHQWDKASSETPIETLAVLPDWQTSRICTMSDGRIVHLISIFLWGDDPGIKSNLTRSHPSVSVAMRRWRLSRSAGWAHSVLSGSTGDDTALVRDKSSRGSCRHWVKPGKTFTAFITGRAVLIQGRWGIDDNFRVQKPNLHSEWF